MASSSSANKVAKLAQKGKGKKVRFQGGTLFPLIIVIVVLLFGSLIVYARQSRPGAGEGEPTANQHWHGAVGFYVCDDKGLKTEPNLSGTLEETDASGQLTSQGYANTGVHSHGDGVMHWHPSSSGRATGTNARLKVFLSNYNVTLTNTELVFPKSQGGETFKEGKTTCKVDGVEKAASLKVWVWDSYTKIGPDDAQVYTSNMGEVRIKNDGMAFTIAFVPDDVKPKPPESAFNLKELGAADAGGTSPTSVPATGNSTVATATTLAGDTSSSTSGTTATTAASGEPSATSPTVTSTAASTVTSTVTSTTGG